MIKIAILMITVIVLTLMFSTAEACHHESDAVTTDEAEPIERLESQNIRRANRTHWLNDDYYVTYKWNNRPRIGHYVLVVNVYNKNKKSDTDWNVTANAYMPSMRGAHDTGDIVMRVNDKGEYLVPVHFMMRGDWEIELKFGKEGQKITRAFIQLDI